MGPGSCHSIASSLLVIVQLQSSCDRLASHLECRGAVPEPCLSHYPSLPLHLEAVLATKGRKKKKVSRNSWPPACNRSKGFGKLRADRCFWLLSGKKKEEQPVTLKVTHHLSSSSQLHTHKHTHSLLSLSLTHSPAHTNASHTRAHTRTRNSVPSRRFYLCVSCDPTQPRDQFSRSSRTTDDERQKQPFFSLHSLPAPEFRGAHQPHERIYIPWPATTGAPVIVACFHLHAPGEINDTLVPCRANVQT